MIEREFSGIEHGELGGLLRPREADQKFLEAKYLGDVAEFRADVINRLVQNDALHDREGWLMYDEVPRQESGVLVDERGKKTLIMFYRTYNGEIGVPHIKIMTNREFWINDHVAFLTEDVTIDDDGDSQLLVDTVFFDQDGVVQPSLMPGEPSYSPVFWLKADGVLSVANVQNYTPIVPAWAEIARPDGSTEVAKVTPFGRNENLEDKIAALEWGRALFKATGHAELVGKCRARK